MLIPLLPLRPHRFARPAWSPSWSEVPSAFRFHIPAPTFESPIAVLGLPPKIADTVVFGDGIRFRISVVMETHSDITRETGSTATVTGRLRYCIRAEAAGSRSPGFGGIFEGAGFPSAGGKRRGPSLGCRSLAHLSNFPKLA